jgi:hypothetical protein
MAVARLSQTALGMRNESHAVLDEPVFELVRPVNRNKPLSPRLVHIAPDVDPDADVDPTHRTYVVPASGRVVFLGLTMLFAVAGIAYSAVYLSIPRGPSASAPPSVAEMQGP